MRETEPRGSQSGHPRPDPISRSDTTVVADEVSRVFKGIDVEAARAAYWGQNEFVYFERLLPPAVTDVLVAEVNRVRPQIHRNYIPRHKKGGSVSYFTLLEHAPAILTLYRHPAFMSFLSSVTGRGLMPCPERDPHSAALYFYTEPGDHIGFHYDTSYYKGTRFTILVGLIERSSSRLVCQLYKDDPGRETVEMRIATDPGTLILFNGDKLWHAITPLGEREERVSLTLEYVTDPSMAPHKRLFSDLKDAFAYFGLKSVFLGGPRKT